MQKYLEKALVVLEKFDLMPEKDDGLELVNLLEELRHIDEAKVLAIGRTFRHMSSFNELVRKTVEDITIGQRYADITEMFDSIREDSKTLVDQLGDGEIDFKEKLSTLWMKIRRGSPHDRFEKIRELYTEVCEETSNQLKREDEVLDAYIDFRFSIKEAEGLSLELLEVQENNLEQAKEELLTRSKFIESSKELSGSALSDAQLLRDEAMEQHQSQDRSYQLIKDIY